MLGCKPRVSQANEAAIHPKLTGLCQHEIVSGIMKKWNWYPFCLGGGTGRGG